MKKVFIADDMFVAFIDRAHPRHAHAKAFFRLFAKERMMLFTSIAMIERAYDVLCTHVSPSLARSFVKAIGSGTINTIYPDERDVQQTYARLETTPNLEIRFSDALTAALCERHHIHTIGTFTYVHPTFGMTQLYMPI